ncbi:YajG family lipoprotein [Pseudoalteromonas rubra]|uniref:YajG family lipoprotein n=1 Tax=Pseudoalteromonas rubra TaxID=43658 RepID=UPI000F7B3506|nr:YajG family lipoprotein [Pseudoalteromonas rubra]
MRLAFSATLFGAAITLLAGCSSAPKSVILNPSYQGGNISQLSNTMAIKVVDNRTTKFTIKVLEQEPAVYLPNADLPVTLTKLLSQALEANGVTLAQHSDTQLTLRIRTFVAKVDESLSRHESTANADFVVEVVKGQRTFSKPFNGEAQFSKPLKHDQSQVEGQLNRLAEQVITRMLSDKELIDFLQQ